MSTYTPKIVIAQFGKAEKAKRDNANGEIQLLIEKSLSDPDRPSEQQPKRNFTTKLAD